MPNDAPSNATDSGETSRRQPNRPRNEAEFLAQEAAMARSALTASVSELRDYCTTENLVRRWIGRHPWLTLSLASVAGVAVARAVTSLRKAPTATDVAPEPIDSAATAEPRATASTPWWMSLITPLMPMVMSIAEDTIRSAISSKMRGQR